MRLGFIGQGWIGRNYADHFADRGFDVVRYAKEEPYAGNAEAIVSCDIVFIAVPTPTTKEGFSAAAVEDALRHVGKGKTAIVKSTVLPGTTRALQALYPDRTVLFSPEFLREASARHDVDHPDRNIIGITDEAHRAAAEAAMAVLPRAPHEDILKAEEAELVKYAGNIYLFIKVVYMNMLYDLAASFGGDWEKLAANISADPRIGKSHMHPVHASGHGGSVGRGAGGHCFIKDFAAFSDFYKEKVRDGAGHALLDALAAKNIDLLVRTGKDLELLAQVYGSLENGTIARVLTNRFNSAKL